MNHTLFLGHYTCRSNIHHAFHLYQVKNTSILLFRLKDILNLFKLPQSVSAHLDYTSNTVYQDQQQYLYIVTTALVPIAIKHNKFLLAELCKLKETDYTAHIADSILNNLPHLQNTSDPFVFKSTDIQFTVLNHPILESPQQDPHASTTTVSSGAGSHITKKQSRPLDEGYTCNNKKHKSINEAFSRPNRVVNSQQTPPTSLFSKSMPVSGGKNTRNLTIYTPSYDKQFTSGIRSAPLHSNFRTSQPKNGPHPLSQLIHDNTSPNTPEHDHPADFAIPPIVPSQQQPPHTAHPSSHHFPPPSPQYPSTAYGHSFPVASGRMTVDTLCPKTPTTHASLHRQQFMQPFEHLFDTLETTRTLKTTLDDQIRRSSTLIQTLQASSTTIEGLVRNQMKEAQKEMVHKMEDSIHALLKRVAVLEGNSNTSTPPMQTKKESYLLLLDSLKVRLDKLERQFDS